MRFGWRRKPVRTDVRAAYALWAPSYPPAAHNPLMRAEEEAVVALFPDVAGHRSLDLACGSGRYLRLLLERGASPIGLDLSPEMLGIARQPDGPALIAGDMERLPFGDATFESIVCSLAVGHLRELGAFAGETARVLRPGGRLVYSDFHPFLTLHDLERTFRDVSGVLRAVDQHLHLYRDHHRALTAAGLAIEAVAEPAGETRDRRLPKRSPLALVIRARKS